MTYETAQAEIERLRDLCAEVYQVVGALAFGRDEEVLVPVIDNLAAGAAGEPLPHASLLPFTDTRGPSEG